MKLLFGFFSDHFSYPASMLGRMASDSGWDVELAYFNDTAGDDEIYRTLHSTHPDLVALSIKTFERKPALRVAAQAKALGLSIIAGGPHATGAPYDLADTGYFNAVVVGDGAGIFETLLGGYPGMTGEVVHGKKHWDNSVYCRRLFSEAQQNIIRQNRMLSVATSIGCPFNCSFCATMKNYIPLSPEMVVGQLSDAKKDYDIKFVNFLDDTLTYNLERLKEFRRLIEERDLDLQFMEVNGRVETFSEPVAEELAKLGVRDISFGVETASQKLLNFLNKKNRVEDIYRARKVCRDFGMAFKSNIMAGIPTQDQSDYDKTLDFIKNEKPDVVAKLYFTPFPGTALFDYCITNNHMPDNWTFDHYLFGNGHEPDFKGWRNTSGLLKNIDYDMADQFMASIDAFEYQRIDRKINEVAKKADQTPWVLVGSRKYFYTVLERLSRTEWENLLGYIELEEEGYQQREFSISIPKYDRSKTRKLFETAVVTIHPGTYLNNHIQPWLKSRFDFRGKILSASTYLDRSLK